MGGESLKQLAGGSLLAWFAENRRTLPWRSNRTAYRVWVSELMLQQTRVDQAIGYYRRFLRRFPSLRALADAPLDDVLKQWEGLGYYARARNLHRAARVVRDEYGGRFPRDYARIRALPGIGEYTAAAVASLAFGQDYPVLDGNVMRVLSRFNAFGEDVKRTASKKVMMRDLEEALPRGSAGAFNEAMMELGAVVCMPRAPDCPACPLRSGCRAYREAGLRPEDFPVKTKKRPVPEVKVAAAVTVNKAGKVLIARRPVDAMLGGLWEFPGGKIKEGERGEDAVVRELWEETGLRIAVAGELLTVKHAYSHFKLRMRVFLCRTVGGRARCLACAAVAWTVPEDWNAYAFSRADLKVIEHIHAHPDCLKLPPEA